MLQTEDRQDEANGILEESSLCDVFRPFLEKEPEWDVVCSVTDSMVSGSWGLKSFIIGDRGYLYYEPVLGRWGRQGGMSPNYRCLGAGKRCPSVPGLFLARV